MALCGDVGQLDGAQRKAVSSGASDPGTRSGDPRGGCGGRGYFFSSQFGGGEAQPGLWAPGPHFLATLLQFSFSPSKWQQRYLPISQSSKSPCRDYTRQSLARGTRHLESAFVNLPHVGCVPAVGVVLGGGLRSLAQAPAIGGARDACPCVPSALSVPTLSTLSVDCSLLLKNTYEVRSEGNILFNYFPTRLWCCCCQGNQNLGKAFQLPGRKRILAQRLCLWKRTCRSVTKSAFKRTGFLHF